MHKKNIFLLFTTLLFFTGVQLHAEKPVVNILQQSGSRITLEIVFPDPVIRGSAAADSEAPRTYLEIPGLQNTTPGSPFYSRLIALEGTQAGYRILEVKKTAPSAQGRQITAPVSYPGNQPPPLVNLEYLGLFRDIPLFAVTIHPVRPDAASGQVEVVKKIRLELSAASGTQKNSTGTASVPASGISRAGSEILLNSSNVKSQTTGLQEIKLGESGQRYRPGRYKISVKETGLYKITYDLLAQYDIPVDQFDPRRIRLFNRGQEIPIYFKGGADGSFDPGDFFEFWGEQNRSELTRRYEDLYNDPFTDINVYWLEIGETNGLRMVDESGALTVTNPARYITPYAFTEKLHFEEDRAFMRFGNSTARIDSLGHTLDHWFYDRGVSAVGSKTYEAYVPWPFAGFGSATVFVKAMLRGLTEKSISNPLENHLAEIWLNDAKVGASGRWRDQELHVITNIGGLGISQNAIKHGENDLRVLMDQAGVTDIALLNWFEITYQRRYRADKNFLRFKRQENIPDGYTYQFEVDGFTSSDIELYKLGISKLVNNRVDYITAEDNYRSYRISFQDEIFYPDIEYVALTSDAKKKPVSIFPDEPWQEGLTSPSLYDNTNGADYLIVTDGIFYEAARELKAYREQNGLKVEIVRVEDIYDEFNYGIKSPVSIKDFLGFVYRNWDQSHKLMYVLFIGNASYDYKQVSSSQRDLVPTFLFETQKYGSAGSDFVYSLISGDDYVPDIIVSRIPANNNSELAAYIDKVKGYEAPENTGDWRNRALFISGNDGSTKELYSDLPAFRAQNQRLIDMLLPPSYFARKLNTLPDAILGIDDPNYGATQDLIDQFDDGLAMMNFFGHGGGGIWADVQLMNTLDIERLSEHYRLPFIQSMTCFTGAFENASINGLADKLLLAPRKGAIGVLAASGVGWLYNDFAVGWHLTEMILHKDLTIGEAVLFSKIEYYANNLYVGEDSDTSVPSFKDLRKSMVNHYNLLGDPYIKVARPQQGLALAIENTQLNQGDTITVTVNAPFPDGTGIIELANQKQEPITQNFFSLTNSAATSSFTVPQDIEDQRLFVKAFASSASGYTDASGSLDLAVNTTLIDSVFTQPRSPQIGDEVYFLVYVSTPLQIERALITNLKASNGTVYSFDLAYQGDGLWKTHQKFGPVSQADTLFYDVLIYEQGGTSHLLRRRRFIVSDPRPDLQLVENTVKLGGETAVALTYSVKNGSEDTYANLKISYFTDLYPPSKPAFDSTLVDLEPGEVKQLEKILPPAELASGRRFFVAIDHENIISERDETNNVRVVTYEEGLYNVPVNIGSTWDGISNDTLILGQIIGLNIEGQGVTASSVLKMDLLKQPQLVNTESQPGFTYVPFFGQTGGSVIGVDLVNQSSAVRKPFYLAFNIDTTQYAQEYLEHIYICRYSQRLNRWVRLETVHEPGRLQAKPDQTGLFALYNITDDQEPTIEITINGRQVYENMLVPANPDLAFILQDENGIDLSRGLNILVDNDSLPAEVINMPDSLQNANAVSILTTPKLSAGSHTLQVTAQDVNGNKTIRTVNFAVSSGFGIKVYGNYPNPFSDETIVSFDIIADGILDEFSVRIYTVSGRMIREIKRNEEYPDEIWNPGYHEVKWDGRDKDLNIVANGVYFAVVAAKYKGELIEETLKLAKLK